ncbi:MAG: hypothetical protein KGJ90_04665 [Patescibacteria group bacterium]|nr:hypothetical protein [Patescibacteria group bacterium]
MTKQEAAEQMGDMMRRYKWRIPHIGRPRNNKGGRPIALDPAALMVIEDSLRSGATITRALQNAMISRTAWNTFNELNPDYKSRAEMLMQGAISRAEKTLTEALKHDPELALKYLERKLPDEYSLKERIQHSYDFTRIVLDRPKLIEIQNEDGQELIQERLQEHLSSPRDTDLPDDNKNE